MIELGKHGRNRTNVWDYASANSMRGSRREDLALYPTVKPVGLVADAIKDVTKHVTSFSISFWAQPQPFSPPSVPGGAFEGSRLIRSMST
nr:hypothetical protein [Bradyrhizobium liaoningense]